MWPLDELDHPWILGARSLTQLEETLGATGWQLEAEQTRHLDEVSARPMPYPYALPADLVSA